MRVYIPDLDILPTLRHLANADLNELISEDELIFDFSRMNTFYPLPMLMMGSFIKRVHHQRMERGLKTTLSEFQDKTYAGTMGFFKHIASTFPFGKAPGETGGNGNYMPITHLSIPDLRNQYKDSYSEVGDMIEAESRFLARILDRGNKDLHRLLVYVLREMLRNAPEHGHVNDVWVCAQYWPSKKKASIGIVDEGIGIYSSITKNIIHKRYIQNNRDALQWALKAGISQALAPSKERDYKNPWSNSGFGLYMVSQICKELGGSFVIASGSDYIIENSRGNRFGETYFSGTAICIDLPTGNVPNYEQLIDKMITRGETQASSIRGAFRKASTPSRGLMDELGIK